MLWSPAIGACVDHPRSRGVYFWISVRMTPRSWIIPARAGFTTYAAVRGQDHGDHPRSRGVYMGRLLRVGLLPGSSPLARGLR